MGVQLRVIIRAVGIELGLVGVAKMKVCQSDTAAAQGTGDVEALSTPSLLRLMQQATIVALDGHLPEGYMTAGLRVNVDHLHGCPVGSELAATANLTRIEGRRLIFEVEVVRGEKIVGIGRIIRVQLNKERFLSGLS